MFINGRHWTTSSGQHATGSFLLVFQRGWELGREPQPRELRCLVRHVRMNQLGQFMMGEVRLKLPGESDKIRIGLSGPLGSDELPITVPKLEQAPTEVPSRLWELLTSMPEELSDLFWRSNREDGSLQKAFKKMRLWAIANVSQLRRLHVPEQQVGAVR